MSDTQFIDGLIVKPRPDNAPEYVVAKLSIRREELIGWLQAQSGEWVNAEIKKSRNGKLYAAVDSWKPSGDRDAAKPQQAARAPAPTGDAFADDDIPF